MPDSELELCFSGPDAGRLAADLSDFLAAELGERPRQVAETSRPIKAGVRAADPVAVAALVLSIPSALLAVADLAERLEVKKKVDRLLAWVRREAPEGSPNRIEIRSPGGRSLPLEKVESSEVLELSARISVRVARRRES